MITVRSSVRLAAKGGKRLTMMVATVTLIMVAGCLVAISGLNYMAFGDFLRTTYSDRLSVVAFDLGDVIDRGLQLGLSLRQLTDLPGVIRDTESKDNNIRLIRIYEQKRDQFVGLYDHNLEASVDPMPDEWARQMRRDQKKDYWLIDDDKSFGVLLPIINSFQQTIGTLALLQDKKTMERPQTDMNHFLLLVTLAVMAAFVVPVAVATAFAVRAVLRRVAVWQNFLDSLSNRVGKDLPPFPEREEDDNDIDLFMAHIVTNFQREGKSS